MTFFSALPARRLACHAVSLTKAGRAVASRLAVAVREGWLAKADFYFLISPFSPLQSAFRNAFSFVLLPSYFLPQFRLLIGKSFS